MSLRALLICVAHKDAQTLRFRDRLVAAGIPLVALPALAIAAWVILQPPGNSLGAFLAIPAYGGIVTLPALPVVILLSYWFSRRGLIGLTPIMAAGAALGAGTAAAFAVLYSFESAVPLAQTLTGMLLWGGIGSVYALVAWLTLVLLRLDIYSDEPHS